MQRVFLLGRVLDFFKLHILHKVLQDQKNWFSEKKLREVRESINPQS